MLAREAQVSKSRWQVLGARRSCLLTNHLLSEYRFFCAWAETLRPLDTTLHYVFADETAAAWLKQWKSAKVEEDNYKIEASQIEGKIPDDFAGTLYASLLLHAQHT